MENSKITVNRSYFSDCTLSRALTSSGFNCFGLELPWLGNAENISCIPEGEYDYYIAPSPRLGGKLVLWIEDVKDRENIQAHPGNYTSDILGCIVFGDRIMDINNDGIPDVGNSNNTFDKLLGNITEKGTIVFRTADQPGTGVYV